MTPIVFRALMAAGTPLFSTSRGPSFSGHFYPARRAASTADPDDSPRSCSTNNLCRCFDEIQQDATSATRAKTSLAAMAAIDILASMAARNIAFRSMLTPAGWGVLEPARRAALLDLIGQPAPDPHDQGKVWAFNLGCGKDVGKPVLLCPFAITRIGVMANGVQPMKPRSTARPNRGWPELQRRGSAAG